MPTADCDELTIVFFEFDNPLRIKGALHLQTRVIFRFEASSGADAEKGRPSRPRLIPIWSISVPGRNLASSGQGECERDFERIGRWLCWQKIAGAT
jgi:hypothetical protein